MQQHPELLGNVGISDVEMEFWVFSLFSCFQIFLLSQYQLVNLSTNYHSLPNLLFLHAEAWRRRKLVLRWFKLGVTQVWQNRAIDNTSRGSIPRNDPCDGHVLQILCIRVYWRHDSKLFGACIFQCVLALAAGFLCLILVLMSKTGDSCPGVP